jgi:hypothetical protein
LVFTGKLDDTLLQLIPDSAHGGSVIRCKSRIFKGPLLAPDRSGENCARSLLIAIAERDNEGEPLA